MSLQNYYSSKYQFQLKKLGISFMIARLRTSSLSLRVIKILFNASFMGTTMRIGKINHPSYHHLNKLNIYSFCSFKDQFNENTESEAAKLIEQFRQLYLLSDKLLKQQKYVQSRQAMQKCALRIKKSGNSQSKEYIEILFNIVVICKHEKNIYKAITVLQQAKQILANLPNDEQNYSSIVNSNLSQFYYMTNQLQKGIECMKSQLNRHSQTDPDSLNVAILLFKVSQGYQQQDKFQQSLPYLQKALQKFETLKGKDCEQNMYILEQLGFVLYKLQNYQQAVQIQKRRLNMVEKAKGKQSKEYAENLQVLGALHQSLNRLKQSVQYYLESVKVFETLEGESFKNSDSDLYISQKIGITYYGANEFQKAQPYLQKCLNAIRNQQHERSPKYVYILKAAADCKKAANSLQDALKMYQEVLGLIEKNSLECSYVQAQVGQIYYIWKKYQVALEWYIRSLQTQKNVSGKESLHSYNLYEVIAQIYNLLGNIVESERYIQKKKNIQLVQKQQISH